MKFLLVLSDAFDALWAVRGRVALALAGITLVGVLVAVYLPMLSGTESPSPPPVVAHSPTVQGPVEHAKVAPQAPAPPPSTAAPAASSPAPVATATPAPPPPAAPAVDPGAGREQPTAPEQAPPAPDSTPPPLEKAPEAARASAPAAAPAPAAEPVFRVQVGAFREAERARALSRRLTRAGFPTSVLPGTTADGNTIYRVRTRQALAKSEARQLVVRMRHRVPALRPILVPAGDATG
jgi:SPOR domain